MSVTTINGGFVHYEVLGRGKPIVFIHGWLGSWRYWWPCMQTLSKQHRAFAYDQWGFGDSGKVGKKYSFEAYLELLELFVAKLGISGTLNLIGHDVGAAVALRFARLNPERVERLVTVALPTSGSTINDQLVNGKVENYINHYVTKIAPFTELMQESGKNDMVAVTAVARQLVHYDFTDDLQKLNCPILLVFGDRNPVIQFSVNGRKETSRTKEKLQIVTLEGCSHFPMLEQTAIFNRLVQDFINIEENETVMPKDYWQRRTR
jgi:pimeloyl-ACP methyl ester carboxylesterase